MLNKKDNLIIFVLALLVISLAVFVMTKDINLNSKKNQSNSRNINVSQEQKDNRYNLINKNTTKNTNTKPAIDYSGKLTKEENGWKKYRNEYWGIEFRFRDEKDEIRVKNTDRITLLGPVGQVGTKFYTPKNPYIYINFFDYDGKKYNSLKEYLEKGGWNSLDLSAELVSLKKITNNHGLKFIEATFEYMSNRESQKPLVSHKSRYYYINYNKKIISEDEKSFRLLKNAQDFISIKKASGDDNLQQQILDNFKFID